MSQQLADVITSQMEMLIDYRDGLGVWLYFVGMVVILLVYAARQINRGGRGI
jgi:hypothetical protein